MKTINTKDLKLGHWATIDGSVFPIEINLQSFVRLYRTNGASDYKPIELTPDILVSKMGFYIERDVIIGIDSVFYKYKADSIITFAFYQNEISGGLYNWRLFIRLVPGGDFIEMIFNTPQYVHTFQDLYKVLIGKDLKIKL